MIVALLCLVLLAWWAWFTRELGKPGAHAVLRAHVVMAIWNKGIVKAMQRMSESYRKLGIVIARTHGPYVAALSEHLRGIAADSYRVPRD